MLFGYWEIAFFLGTFMVLAFSVFLGLAGQNIAIWFKRTSPRCPKCFTTVNPEAYICWSCRSELETLNVHRKELS